jgi:hypothetical protein
MSEAADAPKERVALVTGASSGIGYELCKLLANDRIDLVLVARDIERLNRIADELGDATGIGVTTLRVDLADPGGPEKVWHAVQEAGLTVEYLINNAGFGNFGIFLDHGTEATLDLLQVNIHALTHLTALFLPGMVERRSGRVMNVASTAAFQAGPLMSTYYASKAYVLHFSEAIAEELEGKGVSVTALCPGPTVTEFHKRARMETSGLVTDRRSMTAEAVAEIGYQGMMRGKTLVIPGMSNKLLTLVVRLAPRKMIARFVHRMQEERG